MRIRQTLRRRLSVLLSVLLLTGCGDSTGSIPAVGGLPAATPPVVSAPAANTGKSLARAHAHNDYDHTRPLLDALDQGFASVEADVYVAPAPGALGNTLGIYVAHDAQNITPQRTLAALYLEPLKAMAAANGGCILKDCAQFYLLIDAKTEAESTYAAVEAELAKYDTLFAKYIDGGVRPGQVIATLSGNRPLDTMKAASSRHLFYDGRFTDLDSNEPATLMPLISDSWTSYFSWDGQGAMPADQKAVLLSAITKSHAKGRRVRLYNVPDAAGSARDNIWTTLIAADQDQINTDDLAGLRAFLLANDPKQR